MDYIWGNNQESEHLGVGLSSPVLSVLTLDNLNSYFEQHFFTHGESGDFNPGLTIRVIVRIS